MKERFYQYIQDLQDRITHQIETIDSEAQFNEDLWERAEEEEDELGLLKMVK